RRPGGVRGGVVASGADAFAGASARGLDVARTDWNSGGVGATSARFPAGGGVGPLDLASVFGLQSTRLAVFALNGLVPLLPVHRDLDGGRDPQSNLITPNIHHGDDDIIADDDTFVAVSGQDQHRFRLLPPASEARDHPESRCPRPR